MLKPSASKVRCPSISYEVSFGAKINSWLELQKNLLSPLNILYLVNSSAKNVINGTETVLRVYLRQLAMKSIAEQLIVITNIRKEPPPPKIPEEVRRELEGVGKAGKMDAVWMLLTSKVPKPVNIKLDF